MTLVLWRYSIFQNKSSPHIHSLPHSPKTHLHRRPFTTAASTTVTEQLAATSSSPFTAASRSPFPPQPRVSPTIFTRQLSLHKPCTFLSGIKPKVACPKYSPLPLIRVFIHKQFRAQISLTLVLIIQKIQLQNKFVFIIVFAIVL
jgi:hypothetical protein